MKFGIEDSIWQEINEVAHNFKEVDRLILFGSRAIGTFRTNSDIDLVFFASDLSFKRFLDLKADLDELELLYGIDLVDFDRIDNEDLRAHILRVGKEIYLKSEKITA